MVHFSENCDDETPHLITHVHATEATRHEVLCTEIIQQVLVAKALAPTQQLVDSAYVDAELLVQSKSQRSITLVGSTCGHPTWRKNRRWLHLEQFLINWEKQQVTYPQGKVAPYWAERVDRRGKSLITVDFSPRDCHTCPMRALCTLKQSGVRRLKL